MYIFFISQFCENDFTLRSRVGHDHQCECFEQDPEFSKIYGVNRRSILCNSRYFHVVDGLPADDMHDILEGVRQYKCKEMLNIFIYERKYFTLQQLNEKIKSFDFGYYNDRNKPLLITRQALKGDANNIRQKGLCFLCESDYCTIIVHETLFVGGQVTLSLWFSRWKLFELKYVQFRLYDT